MLVTSSAGNASAGRDAFMNRSRTVLLYSNRVSRRSGAGAATVEGHVAGLPPVAPPVPAPPTCPPVAVPPSVAARPAIPPSAPAPLPRLRPQPPTTPVRTNSAPKPSSLWRTGITPLYSVLSLETWPKILGRPASAPSTQPVSSSIPERLRSPRNDSTRRSAHGARRAAAGGAGADAGRIARRLGAALERGAQALRQRRALAGRFVGEGEDGLRQRLAHVGVARAPALLLEPGGAAIARAQAGRHGSQRPRQREQQPPARLRSLRRPRRRRDRGDRARQVIEQRVGIGERGQRFAVGEHLDDHAGGAVADLAVVELQPIDRLRQQRGPTPRPPDERRQRIQRAEANQHPFISH